MKSSALSEAVVQLFTYLKNISNNFCKNYRKKTVPESLFISSHPDVFLLTGILKICSKFTGKHSCRSVIAIKLQSNFIEITLPHGCSSVNLFHIFRTDFSKNTSGWLLLSLPDQSASWRPSTLFKRFQRRYFPMYITNFFKNTFFTEDI